MHHKTRSLSLLALVAALGSPAARAQTILEDIVVTPDRLETEAARTGSTVSVIDGATIEADGRPFALDYLANEPGINVSQTGPAGTISGFTLRGAPQTYTRVLVDGIEISDPTAPQVNPSLSGFPADDIGRIEVLRGSQSAIYGGQAVAGIIDITSPRATEDGIALNYRAEGGSFDSYRGALGLTGRDERGEFALNVTTIDTDGFSAAEAADGNTESDGYSTTRVSASGTLYLSETSAFSGAAFWQTDEGDYDDGPGAGGDAPNTFETETAGARLGLDFESFDQIENSLAVTWFQLDRTQTNAFGPFTSEGDRARIEYLGRYEVSDQWDLRFGADYMRETAETNFFDGQRTPLARRISASPAPSDRRSGARSRRSPSTPPCARTSIPSSAATPPDASPAPISSPPRPSCAARSAPASVPPRSSSSPMPSPAIPTSTPKPA